MKNCIVWSVLFLAVSSFAQDSASARQPATLKSILLTQLRETHNQKNWFVSEKEATAELTAEQAAWSDGKNHSVGQLVHHLAYWNSFNLATFKGEKPKALADNNDTFKFDSKDWDATLKEYDSVMNEWEHIVETADEATLAKWAPLIAHTAAHNAYHIGEIIAVRKEHGMWNPDLGVK